MNLSLRARLSLVYGTVFLGSMLALDAALYWGARTALDSVVNQELESRQVGVVEYLDKHLGKLEWPQIRESLASAHEALRPRLLAVLNDRGAVLFSPTPAMAIPGPRGLSDRNERGTPLRVRTASVTIHGSRYTLAMASDLTFPLAMLRRLVWVMLLSSPLALGIACVAGYWVSGRVLTPVAEITALAESLSAHQVIRAADLGQRVAVPSRADELQRLTRTINSMLAKVEESFRQMTRFTADVSHEFRTPLAVIRATAEIALLRVQPTEDSYRESLGRILRESEKHSTLLDAMLRLSRFEVGVEHPRRQRVDLRASVLRAVDEMLPLADEKQVTLATRVGERPMWVLADEEHLRWLWAILLDNAIKYSVSGSRAEVCLDHLAGRLCCSVSDEGIGIGEADLPRVFQPFYRADTSRTRSTGGAGLGLSVARQIIETNEAQVAVESCPGRGTTFRVSFEPADQDDNFNTTFLRKSSGLVREDVTGRR